jgi:hypothetical protein
LESPTVDRVHAIVAELRELAETMECEQARGIELACEFIILRLHFSPSMRST